MKPPFLTFCLLLLMLGGGNFTAQKPYEVDDVKGAAPKKAYDKAADALVMDSLMRHFGKNKILPHGFELAALRALSHYPELAEETVIFKFAKQKVAHSSKPKPGSLLRRHSKRKYIITISNELKPSLEPTMLKSLPYNAQIGVLGHELAHSVYYYHTGSFKIIAEGMKYANKKFRKKYENDTDLRTIEYGLGWQLKAWSEAVHDHHIADGRGENYLSPSQIEAVLTKHPKYRSTH